MVVTVDELWEQTRFQGQQFIADEDYGASLYDENGDLHLTVTLEKGTWFFYNGPANSKWAVWAMIPSPDGNLFQAEVYLSDETELEPVPA
jgi:hypothetical protein